MDRKEWELIFSQKCDEIKKYPSVIPAVNRIIVIGDLHGDWDITVKSLKVANLIDKNLNWIGGDTVVVQVGDQIDRCRFTGISCKLPEATKDDESSDLKILNYFTKLHNQAQKHGGAVYSIIGNHELMNVKGDMRYVSYENIKDFDNYKKPNGDGFKDGMEARKWAFSPGNPIANFLGCTRQLALIIGSNLFVHAGVLPKISEKYGISDMNQVMSLFLWDKINNKIDTKDLLDSADFSPLWNRVFGSKNHNQIQCDNLMTPLKNVYNVDRIFVGHSPQDKTGITNTCNGKIWLTDYGASKAFDKYDNNFLQNGDRSEVRKAQVLEILNDGEQINILK